MTKQHKIIRLGIIYFAAFALALASTIVYLSCTHARERWTPEQAWAWHKTQPWLVGANFIPSTAINQLEMFQAETFDAATIDRELGYAEKLGFTSMRVFLHDLLWLQDSDGFLKRLDRTLALAEKHNIGLVLVPQGEIVRETTILGHCPKEGNPGHFLLQARVLENGSYLVAHFTG